MTETSFSVRLQSEAVLRSFSVINLPFASQSQHLDFLYVRVRHPDGTLVETPVTEALEQPAEVTREAPFYSDLKQKQLPVRGLQVGDTLEWKTRLVRTVPEAPGEFWGQDTFFSQGIALSETVELHVPAASHVKIWTNPGIAAPADTTSGTERVIRWHHSNLEPTAGPVATAAAEAAKTKLLTPEQELTNQKGALPSLAWTTFADWQAVGAWYRSLESDRDVPDAAIKAKVAELTAGKTTQLQQAMAIYDYVSTQIRYIGVAFGIGRYQPHAAADAYANQYGDCKDKHTLLAAMLVSLGLHPDAVLIGAGVRFNNALPSPAAFNHLITQVPIDGKVYWLDTTAEVSPFDTLVPALRDQQALVIPDKGAAQVERTPKQTPFLGDSRMTVSETLGKGFASDAQVALTFHDDDAIVLRSLLRQISPAQYGEFVQRFMAQWGFGGTTSEASISSPDAIEEPLKFTFRYKRIKEDDWGANRVTEPFMPITLPSVDAKQPPVASLQLGAPRTETSTVTMVPPDNWRAEVPEAVHASSPYATVDMVFHLEHGTLIGERKLTVLQSSVPASDWKVYKAWIDKAEPFSVPFIQLVAASASALQPESKGSPSAATPAVGKINSDDLLRQAREQLQLMNPVESRKLLDRVKASNPAQRGLWFVYAGAAQLLGEINEAIADVRKELAAYPDEPVMYGYLAELQKSHGEDEAALLSSYAWVNAAPNDPAAATALVRMLHSLKRDPEAVKAGTASLNRLSHDDTDLTLLRLTLADVEHGMGQKAEAAATVRPLSTTVTDPSQVNSVTYLLAEGGIDLPGDEARERAMLSTLEAATATWTLDEAPRTLAGKTNLLIASWDTLGWILFLEGHPAEARALIEAAWKSEPNPEITEHLHAIRSALHESPDAGEQQSAQQRRTFPLGSANGKHGVSQVRVLFGSHGVLRTEPYAPPVIPGAPAERPNTSHEVSGALELAKSADLHTLLPPGNPAHLVREGFVNCVGATCQLVLSPLR